MHLSYKIFALPFTMRIASVGHLRIQVMQPMHFSLSRTTVSALQA